MMQLRNVTGRIKAGAACLGMGSKFFTNELIASGNYSVITEKVSQLLSWVQTARNGKSPIA
jgi:2-keto-3-deoxy-6-phosphogluconate aldolase